MSKKPGKVAGKESVVLVTGGSGLVGHGLRNAVTKALDSEDDCAVFIWLSSRDTDLRCYNQASRVFEKHKPTHVVHLAAKVGGLFANMEDNIGFFQDNMDMNRNVVRLCHEYKVERAIFCLSTCVFPMTVKLPFVEDDLHLGPPHPSNEGYAMSKRVLEMLVRFYQLTYNYDWLCVIPTNMYGPYDNFNLEQSHVIPGLIHKSFLAKKTGGPFTVAGSGKPLRQFLYSYDAGRILLTLLRAPEEFRFTSVILTDQTEFTIKDVATSIARAMDYKQDLVFDTSKAEGIFQKTASNERLRKLLPPSFEFTDFHKGIDETVEFFMSHYDTDLRR